MNPIVFGYLAAAILLLSLLAVTNKNPVHAILLVIVMFFHMAVMYIGLGAEFLAAVQVIVYAGAILVLFLFVVFVLNIREETGGERFSSVWPFGLSIATGLLLLAVILSGKVRLGAMGPYTPQVISAETHTKILGRVLYTDYILPFEIASLILLVAVVGAITLAGREDR
ncbi:MAG: NADH-quinone oxidoreductase subunit J [Actinomycetota bacterium]|nr:NADH-quinone oxidoreductase subunit J [Actinomycetota bacterium]